MLTFSSLLRLLRWPRSMPRWRSLCDVSSAPEAALVSARCRYSLSTVEVICNPSVLFCALVEQEHPGTWRWAVYGAGDEALEEGTAPTNRAARRAALRSLVALGHRGVIQLDYRPPAAPASVARA